MKQMRSNPQNVSFADLRKVCEYYFGHARQTGSSDAVFRTPRAGNPRVNIRNDHGKAKTYQIKQVLAAIHRLKGVNDEQG